LHRDVSSLGHHLYKKGITSRDLHKVLEKIDGIEVKDKELVVVQQGVKELGGIAEMLIFEFLY
jgi:hypothetical protein